MHHVAAHTHASTARRTGQRYVHEATATDAWEPLPRPAILRTERPLPTQGAHMLTLQPGTVIGHRGSRGGVVRGNTLSAFAAAINAGADAVELDVRRTKDGVLVVNHDARAGNRLLGPLIATTRYADLPPVPGTGERIPRLDEVVALTRGRTHLDVEMKEVGYEDRTLQVLLSRLSPDQFLVSSFKVDALRAVERLAPAVRTALLVYRLPGVRTARRLLSPIGELQRARAVGVDALAVDQKLLNPALLNAAHGAGMPVLVWTVDDPGSLNQLLADPRISGVITDRPQDARPAPTRQLVLGAPWQDA